MTLLPILLAAVYLSTGNCSSKIRLRLNFMNVEAAIGGKSSREIVSKIGNSVISLL